VQSMPNGQHPCSVERSTERMAQSVSHVEFMSELRTTQLEREKLLQEIHAVFLDMTGM
jgi:hypothetical protein